MSAEQYPALHRAADLFREAQARDWEREFTRTSVYNDLVNAASLRKQYNDRLDDLAAILSLCAKRKERYEKYTTALARVPWLIVDRSKRKGPDESLLAFTRRRVKRDTLGDTIAWRLWGERRKLAEAVRYRIETLVTEARTQYQFTLKNCASELSRFAKIEESAATTLLENWVVVTINAMSQRTAT